jgi:hypothetical protein
VYKKKKSLGRDVFEEPADKENSNALKELIVGKGLRASSDTKQIPVNIKLTPSNIRHLERLQKQLAESGKGTFTRNQLIRIAITLLNLEDF